MMFEEMMHMAGEPRDPVTILMAASLMRDDAPWLYELAMEAYRAVQLGDAEGIQREIKRLQRLSTVMMRSPFMIEFGNRESHMITMEFPRMLDHMLRRTLERANAPEAKKPRPRKRRTKAARPSE
jgi:hypothetical protein